MKLNGKLLMLSASLLGAASLLGQAQAQEKVTLRFWSYAVSSAPFLQKEVDLFQKANPNIKVEFTTTANPQYAQTLSLAYRSGNAPDVFYIPGDINFQQMLKDKWMLGLNKWATPAWQANFPSGSFVEGDNIIDGQVISAPMYGRGANWIQLYINNKVFRDAGLTDAKGKVRVPKTWEEQRRYAKQILERSSGKVYGLGFAGKGGDFPLFTQAFSIKTSGAPTAEYGFLNYKTGRYEYASNSVFRAWFEHWITMKEDGSFFPESISLNDEQIRVPFTQNRYGMLVSGGWIPNSLKAIDPNFTDYTIASLPTLKGRATTFMPETGGGRQIAVSSQTKNADAAWKLFNFLYSKESATRWVKAGEGNRVYPSTNRYLSGKTAEVVKVAQKDGKLVPNFSLLRPQLQDIKQQQVTPNLEFLILAAYTGQLKRADVPSALKKLEDDSNAALEDAVIVAQKNNIKVTLKDFVFPSWNPLVDQTTAK